MNTHEHPWTLAGEDLGWMWYEVDPHTAKERNGDFPVYLLHELGALSL
jgi:hypothetical protein